MSETETWRGKIKCINSPDLELDEHLNELIKCYKPDYEYENGLSIEENFREAFWREDKFLLIRNKIYEVLEQEDISYDDVFEASQNSKGEISFLVQYYNGGCCFSEAVETAIENMEKE